MALGGSGWLVLGIAASGLFLICVDLTVLYVALPALTRDLAATNTERLWILNAYPIVVAGLLPGLGTLGDECLLMVYGFGDKFPGAKVVMVNEKNEIIDLIDYK